MMHQNLEDLKVTLEQKYKILCYNDLADVNQSHSSVYKIFQKYRKDKFENNERIVFYSAHAPSDQLLQHLQHAANLIDISSCFIMICGPHNIDQKLKNLSHDTNQIEYYSANIDSKILSADLLNNNDTLCPMPWMNLAVMNLGECKACCVSTAEVGSAVDSSLNDLFYSKSMNSLRRSMLSGTKPVECSHCWNLEDQHIKSNRQWHMEFYSKQFYTDWLDNPSIRSLDVRPSNICNFKCRICIPESSSLVTAEHLKLTTNTIQISKLKNINVHGRWFDHHTKFIDQITELLPSLINIDFYGGEPFLLKQLPKFLKIAVDSGRSKHIKLHFNTNGSIFPSSLLCYLEQFKQVDISISIDNVGKRFEFERGGSWDVVEQHVKRFNTETNFDISIMPTLNIQNILYIDDVITWADRTNNRIVFNYLDNPLCMNIDQLTPAAKQLVVVKYENHNHQELRSIVERVKNSQGSDGTAFVNYMKTLDQHRGQHFSESHKEIAFAMGYSV